MDTIQMDTSVQTTYTWRTCSLIHAYWYTVYIACVHIHTLTPYSHIDTIFTHWHHIHTLTPYSHIDTIFTHWHHIHTLTPYKWIHPYWHPAHGGDETWNIWIFRLDSVPVFFFGVTGTLVYLRGDFFEICGAPVKTYLKVAGTPVKTCLKFGSCKYSKSDLLRPSLRMAYILISWHLVSLWVRDMSVRGFVSGF